MKVRGEIDIAAPPHVVFAHIADPQLVARRIPGMRYEWLTAPMVPGAQLRLARPERGGRMLADAQIVVLEPPTHFESRSTTWWDPPPPEPRGERYPRAQWYREVWTVTPHRSGSLASVRLWITLPGLWALAGWLGKGKISGQMGSDLIRLKDSVEGRLSGE